MQKHKRKSKARATQLRKPTAPGDTRALVGPPLDQDAMVPGPQLRRILGISPVTLWRWRHDESMGFPKAKNIQDRLYFSWKAVSAWLAARPEAA